MVSLESDRSTPLPHLPAYASRGRDRTAASEAPAASDRSRTLLFWRRGAILWIDTPGSRSHGLVSANLEIARQVHVQLKGLLLPERTFVVRTFGLRRGGNGNLQFFVHPFVFLLLKLGASAKRVSPRFQYFCTAPVSGGLPAVRPIRMHTTLSPCPFFHHAFLKDRRCGSPTAARTPPAHKPPASMSSSAGRLRHGQFDERSTWKFPPGGPSPHWRPGSAFF